MTKVLGSRVEGTLPHTIKAIRETCSQYHPKWQQNMKQLHRTQEQWDRAVHYNYSVRRLCWSNRQDNKESKGIQVRQSVHVSLFADDTVLPIKDSKNYQKPSRNISAMWQDTESTCPNQYLFIHQPQTYRGDHGHMPFRTASKATEDVGISPSMEVKEPTAEARLSFWRCSFPPSLLSKLLLFVLLLALSTKHPAFPSF